MTTQKIKKLLEQYRWILEEEQSIRTQRDRWQQLAERITPVFSHTPKGTERHDRVGTAVAELARLDELWEALLIKKIRILRQTEQVIEQVENPQYRTVLRMRYLQGMTIESVADQLHYSWVQMQRICTAAVKEACLAAERGEN